MTPAGKQEVLNIFHRAGDVTSITILGASLTEYIPAAAALASLIWAGIRIYETETVQRILGRKKDTTDQDD